MSKGLWSYQLNLQKFTLFLLHFSYIFENWNVEKELIGHNCKCHSLCRHITCVCFFLARSLQKTVFDYQARFDWHMEIRDNWQQSLNKKICLCSSSLNESIIKYLTTHYMHTKIILIKFFSKKYLFSVLPFKLYS